MRVNMKFIKGIHHINLQCSNDKKYDEVKHFYMDVLGLDVAHSWDCGVLFDTGNGLIEVFNTGVPELEQGVVRHFSLAAEDVDACVDAVKKAGYEVFVEPKDIEIASTPVFPARIAFCRGPLGEEIEFFCESNKANQE